MKRANSTGPDAWVILPQLSPRARLHHARGQGGSTAVIRSSYNTAKRSGGMGELNICVGGVPAPWPMMLGLFTNMEGIYYLELQTKIKDLAWTSPA